MFHVGMKHDGAEALRAAAEAMAELGKQLAHPLRLLLLTYVSEHGPCAFSELVEVAGASQAQVGNHLTVLRSAGLLVTERRGRQSLYRLPNADLAELLANLGAAAGVSAVDVPVARPGEEARCCYDHVGGRLGVAVLRTLLERDAVIGDPAGADDLVPGAGADTVLPEFGVAEWAQLHGTRRRFAYGCPDWTEKAPHLGGALGAAVAESMRERRWTKPRSGSRALDLTPRGRSALRELGVSV